MIRPQTLLLTSLMRKSMENEHICATPPFVLGAVFLLQLLFINYEHTDGASKIGKSCLLLQSVNYAYERDWIVLYFPTGNSI